MHLQFCFWLPLPASLIKFMPVHVNKIIQCFSSGPMMFFCILDHSEASHQALRCMLGRQTGCGVRRMAGVAVGWGARGLAGVLVDAPSRLRLRMCSWRCRTQSSCTDNGPRNSFSQNLHLREYTLPICRTSGVSGGLGTSEGIVPVREGLDGLVSRALASA